MDDWVRQNASSLIYIEIVMKVAVIRQFGVIGTCNGISQALGLLFVMNMGRYWLNHKEYGWARTRFRLRPAFTEGNSSQGSTDTGY